MPVMSRQRTNWFPADQIAAELAYPLDLFIEKRRFDPQGKNIFYYYVYAFEDYTLFQPRIPQMFSEKLRLMEENGILAELVIFDLNPERIIRFPAEISTIKSCVLYLTGWRPWGLSRLQSGSSI